MMIFGVCFVLSLMPTTKQHFISTNVFKPIFYYLSYIQNIVCNRCLERKPPVRKFVAYMNFEVLLVDIRFRW